MDELDHLLLIAKETVRAALKVLADRDAGMLAHRFANDFPREMKAAADRVLDDEIQRNLAIAKLPILSEESAVLVGSTYADLHWVVDPLDGTVNFIRGLAPCAVSIALCKGDVPIFGVIGEYPAHSLAWGGPSIGTFIEGRLIHVSTVDEKSQAVLCTGFPSRFNFEAELEATQFLKVIGTFAKVRMLGAASLSLLHVAKGAADAYAEQDIMIWDVAAGLALVEGAGGRVSVSPGRYRHSLNIFASNGLLQHN